VDCRLREYRIRASEQIAGRHGMLGAIETFSFHEASMCVVDWIHCIDQTGTASIHPFVRKDSLEERRIVNLKDAKFALQELYLASRDLKGHLLVIGDSD